MVRVMDVFLLGLTGCKGDGLGGIFGDDNGDTNSGSDIEVPLGAADETLSGNLSSGDVIDIGWADDNPLFCWVETENINFDGAHVFFEVDKQGSDDVFVRATPDDDVDVSLYTLEFYGDVETPPDITDATRCEAAFDASGDSNPGGEETIELQGYGDRTLLVGVAGANGATSGAFEVDVWKEDATVGDETGE